MPEKEYAPKMIVISLEEYMDLVEAFNGQEKSMEVLDLMDELEMYQMFVNMAVSFIAEHHFFNIKSILKKNHIDCILQSDKSWNTTVTLKRTK